MTSLALRQRRSAPARLFKSQSEVLTNEVVDSNTFPTLPALFALIPLRS
jgi:hypothetical protein